MYVDTTSDPSFNNKTVINHAVRSGWIWFLIITYGLISIVGVCGNTVVIIAVIRNVKMRSVINIFITNVAVADLLTGLLSVPFQLHAAAMQVWLLPDFMCHLSPMILVLSVSISVLTLAVIAIDRYYAVIHPMKLKITKFRAKFVIIVIWIIGTASSLPTALFYRVQHGNDTRTNEAFEYCDADWPGGTDFGKYYQIYLFTVQYIFPLVIISFSYIKICVHLWLVNTPGDPMHNRDAQRNRNKKKVVKMLITVVCLFTFCWLPLQVYNLASQIDPTINDSSYIHIVWYCCNWLAMSNSCHNPFIYGLLNEKFQQEFIRVFRCAFCLCRDSSGLCRNLRTAPHRSPGDHAKVDNMQSPKILLTTYNQNKDLNYDKTRYTYTHL